MPVTDSPSDNNPFIAPLPAGQRDYPRGRYDPYPTFESPHIDLFKGYAELAQLVADEAPNGLRVLAIDGFHGVDWDRFQAAFNEALVVEGVQADWLEMAATQASPETIRTTIEPFLGGDDPLFGTLYPLGPDVFFDPHRLAELRRLVSARRGAAAGAMTIVYGCGAGLVEQWDALWYADIPKDVIQAQAKAGRLKNLGAGRQPTFGEFYKRSFFVDWPALNRQKRRLLPRLDLFIDLQDPAQPTALAGAQFRAALHELAESPFRVRPWYYSGPWGGRFMQGHMDLDPEQPNFACSFELIAPENGIVLRCGEREMEFSFDCLMYQEQQRMLGVEAARQFGHEWPIRFDYLDTIDGGNLSVQCHPRLDYIQAQFGETFTQDETYYISNAQPGARVFLGLQEDIDPDEFRSAVEHSEKNAVPVDVDKFVNSEPCQPHDLFLIPGGTVHCSGTGNLVLEISATPYIYTFKIYDYLRPDLSGQMRPLNISRAWDNIQFQRRTAWVRENLIARPRLLREGTGWREFVLADRPESFIIIHRIEFDQACKTSTNGRGLTVNLVQGEAVEVVAANGRRYELAYLETMVIPAATDEFTVINKGAGKCMLVTAFVRPGTGRKKPLHDPE